MASSPVHAQRLPLQARSRATRQRLLAGAVASLIELGLAGTTTTAVCRRAGVSQGALFKHFPTKGALIAAATRHLFAELVEDFGRSFTAASREETDRVAVVLAVLRATFAQPRLLAALDLYTAARTDPELRAWLSPAVAEHRENLRRVARSLFPEATRLADFDALVDTVISALQGAALGGLVVEDPEGESRGLAVVERLVRSELARV